MNEQFTPKEQAILGVVCLGIIAPGMLVLKGVVTIAGLLQFVMIAVVALFALAVYLLPTLKACANGRKDWWQIGLLNFYCGWTLLGWVIALFWSMQRKSA